MSNWVNKSIFYHIYPLGFCGAPEYNDGATVYRLDKINGWITHLKELNVNAIYFGPVFESTKHGYDTKDYYKIDCRLGSNESFKKICDTLHKNGIKIVLDGVFNHVGRDFWAFRDVQQKRESSEYCGWFHNLNFGGNSPMGDPFWYEGWSGHYDLVKLNLQNPQVVEHLLGAVGMWIDEFGIDGLRLDAADCVDLGFFRQLKDFCKSKNPDFWLMGEIIHGDYNRWANKDTLDSVTNYECYKGIYSSHNDHNYFEIAHSLQRQFQQGGIYQNLCLYSFLDNHDVNRIASNIRDKNHLNNAYTVMYCMPGVPSIYYGSEWAVEGSRSNNSDSALRPELNIGQIDNANEQLNDHLKKLGRIRLALEALQFGNYKNECIRNEQLVFSRSFNNQFVYVALNLNAGKQTVEFNTAGGFSKLTDALTGESFDNTGYVRIDVEGNSARILVMNNGDFVLDTESAPEVIMPEEIITEVEMPEPVFTETEKDENLDDEIDVITIEVPDDCVGKCVLQTITQPEVKQPVIEEPSEETDNDYIPVIEVAMPLEQVTPGRYRHYKGNEYEVVYVAKHSETLQDLVIYFDVNTHQYWARPYDMFIELVEKDGKFIRRFDKLS
ncbi:MAG: DUF1653 domain-containing protein [Acutalibacteraceae bacterium]|nr:DUF1653 domain-containing protein [Acutalibacteraceae bacterium]